MNRALSKASLLPLLVLSFAFVGCESKTAPTGSVRGRITSLNSSVSEGTVSFFEPKSGYAIEFPLASDGSYASNPKKPMPVGSYVVVISPLTEIVDSDPGKTPPARVDKAAPNIPAKYRLQASSPLRATIAAGDNEANFTLTP